MNVDPSLEEKQRQLYAHRSNEVDRARQKIYKQFPRTDTLRTAESVMAGAAKQSANPQIKEQITVRTGPSMNTRQIANTT